jgi:hypothetical protein
VMLSLLERELLPLLPARYASRKLMLIRVSPSGVGMGRKPQLWMKDGDVVEVELEKVGTCQNKIEYTKKETAKL